MQVMGCGTEETSEELESEEPIPKPVSSSIPRLKYRKLTLKTVFNWRALIPRKGEYVSNSTQPRYDSSGYSA
jgi:hypothetical protein